MTVLVTISETLSGAELSDALVGDVLAVGCDLGSVQNNSFAPLIDKGLNTGKQDLYVRHDGVTDPITNCGWYLQEYNTSLTWTYGGARTPALDLAALWDLGDASGTSKNNADGLSGGLWLDQKWDATSVQQFDSAVSNVWIYKTGVGDSLANKIASHVNSMVYDNATVETDATTPVAGSIGKTADSVLGDRSHAKKRIYIPSAYAEGGYYQWETVFAYSFTS
jgi:hypothetical protein